MTASDGKIFLGEYDGTIRIFDMEKGTVLSRVRIPNKKKVKFFTHDGRIFVESWEILNIEIYEISPEGNAEKIGTVPRGTRGRLFGLDNEHYYYSSNKIMEEEKFRALAFRFDKKLQKKQGGHFSEFPDLAIYSQTEDSQNYWFLCSKIVAKQRPHKGFSLVKKSKATGDVTKYQSTEEIKWSDAVIANDQDAVWMILRDKKKRRLISFSKKTKILTTESYSGGEQLIKNLETSGLPSWTYVAHQSHQVFPLNYNDVQQGKEITAEFLLRQKNYRLTPNPDGIWSPKEEKNKTRGKAETTPSVIKRVLNNYVYIRNNLACTYGGNLWFVGTGIKDESLYHLIKAPFDDGDFEIFPIHSNSGAKKQVIDTIVASNNKPAICSQAKVLAKTGGQQSFNTLIEAFKNHKLKPELWCIAQALAKVDMDKTVEVMIKTLNDEDKGTAARAAFILGIVKDKRAVVPLQKAFEDPTSGINCNAASALGALKDPSSVPLLLAGLDSEYAATRKCVLRALGNYKDPGNCQKFYDMWIEDSDQFVQIRAGMSFVSGNCDNEITRNKENNLDKGYCTDDVQLYINKIAEAVVKYPSNGEWKRKLDLGIEPKESDYDENDENAMKTLQILMVLNRWGEEVARFYSAKDYGSLEKNRRAYLIKIVEYKKYEEMIKLFCPKVEFPDFTLWNRIIQEN